MNGKTIYFMVGFVIVVLIAIVIFGFYHQEKPATPAQVVNLINKAYVAGIKEGACNIVDFVKTGKKSKLTTFLNKYCDTTWNFDEWKSVAKMNKILDSVLYGDSL